jgi:hypothetical protein
MAPVVLSEQALGLFPDVGLFSPSEGSKEWNSNATRSFLNKPSLHAVHRDVDSGHELLNG